jgi:hypothetical protein
VAVRPRRVNRRPANGGGAAIPPDAAMWHEGGDGKVFRPGDGTFRSASCYAAVQYQLEAPMPRPSPAPRRRPTAAAATPATALTEFTAAFDNPGALRMLAFGPPGLAPGAPLVVVLHPVRRRL